MKKIVKIERYLTLTCPSNFTINVLNISTLGTEIGYDKFPNSHEDELYKKCPSLHILLESLKTFCNLHRFCKTTFFLIQESLKLCPKTDLYIQYKCLLRDNSTELPAKIHSSFYCLNNQRINVKKVNFMFSNLDAMAEKQVRCPHHADIKKMLFKQCHLKSHCFVNTSSLSPLINHCDSTHVRLFLQCQPIFTESIFRLLSLDGGAVASSRYRLNCPQATYIKSLQTTPLGYGSLRSENSCANMGVFKRRLEILCLGKKHCKIEDSLIKKMKKFCDELFFVFVEYTCEWYNSQLIREAGCSDRRVMEVELAHEESTENSFMFCSNASQILLSLQQRCRTRHTCQLSQLEVETLKQDSCLLESRSKVKIACKNAKDLSPLDDREITLCVYQDDFNTTFDASELSYLRKLPQKERLTNKNKINFKVLNDILDSTFRDEEREAKRSVEEGRKINIYKHALEAATSTGSREVEVTTKNCSSIRADDILGYRSVRMGHWDTEGRVAFENNVDNSIHQMKKNLLISFDRHFTPLATTQEHHRQEKVNNVCHPSGNCEFFVFKLPSHQVGPGGKGPQTDQELKFNIIKAEIKNGKSKSFEKSMKILGSRKERSLEDYSC